MNKQLKIKDKGDQSESSKQQLRKFLIWKLVLFWTERFETRFMWAEIENKGN